MPNFNVTINRTRIIEYSTEITVKAKDEAAAQNKAEEKVSSALQKVELESFFDWNENSDQDEFDYDVEEE